MLSTANNSAQAQLRFSVFSNKHGRLAKALTLKNGTIEKDGATELYEGTVATVAIGGIAELNSVLDALDYTQAISTGTVTGLEPGMAPVTVLSHAHAQARAMELQALGALVGAESLGGEYEAEQRYVERNKDMVKLPEAPSLALLFIDVDDKWDSDCPDQECLRDKYAAILETGLGRFAHVVRLSSSSGILGQPDSRSFHIYFACIPGEVGLVTDLILRRMWAHKPSRGWVSLSKSGQRLQRQLIDAAVFEPSRLIYAGPALLDGLEYDPTRVRGTVVDGIPVVTYDALQDGEDPPPLAELIAKPWAERAGEAASKRKVWAEQRAKAGHAALARQLGKTVSAGDLEALRNKVEKACARFMEHRYLAGAFPLLMADGVTVTVDDVLVEECTARMVGQHSAMHGRQLHDPAEPEYMGGKVTAKLYTDGLPTVHSFAHGATIWRMLISEDRWLAEYLACVDKDARHNWIGASAELVDLPDGPNRLEARLKGGDGARWKAARKQYSEPIDPDVPLEQVELYAGLDKADATWANLYLDRLGPDGGFYLHRGSYAIFDERRARYIVGKEGQPVRAQLWQIAAEAAAARPKIKEWVQGSIQQDKFEKAVRYNMPNADESIFDADPLLIGVPGAVIDLSKGTVDLRAAKRGDMLRKSLRVRPMYGDWTAWEDMLLKLTAEEDGTLDLEQYDFMLGLLAMMLVGHPHKYILAVAGAPNTGKTTFIESLVWAMGADYAATIGKEAVVVASKRYGMDAGSEEKALHGVLGRRLVHTQEFKEGDVFNTGVLKALTGNDTIRARKLYKDAVEGVFRGLLIMVTNYLPSMVSFDEALRQRMLLLRPEKPFMLPNGLAVNPREAHVGRADIRETLNAQAPAFIMALLDVARQHMSSGFAHLHPPVTMLYSKGAVVTDNPLDEFVQQCLVASPMVAGPRVGVTVDSIRERFAQWAMDNNAALELPNAKALGALLDKHGIKRAKAGALVAVNGCTVTVGHQDKVWNGPLRLATIRLANFV